MLLLCPPAPFVNSKIDAYEFTLRHLIEEQGNGDENSQQRESIASILSAARSQIAKEILSRSLKLERILNPGKGNKVEDTEKVSNT